MAKKNRPSVLKRQREAEKRQRLARKAAKAALKRERRMGNKSGQSQIAPSGDVEENAESLSLPAEATDVGNGTSASSSGASGSGTSSLEQDAV